MSPSPNISPGIFKGYYLEQLVQAEAQLLIDVFVKNGYHNGTLTRTATKFQNCKKNPNTTTPITTQSLALNYAKNSKKDFRTAFNF